jgi:type VI secretion system secreted protein VgrG
MTDSEAGCPALYGREALSEPFRWDIEFTTLQANIPGTGADEICLFPDAWRQNVHGMVTRLEWLSTSKDQSHYRLTLSSRLALLGYTRQCAVYQNQSVPEVVERVLHGLEGPDFEFRLEIHTRRVKLSLSGETDLQFIQRFCLRWDLLAHGDGRRARSGYVHFCRQPA